MDSWHYHQDARDKALTEGCIICVSAIVAITVLTLVAVFSSSDMAAAVALLLFLAIFCFSTM